MKKDNRFVSLYCTLWLLVDIIMMLIDRYKFVNPFGICIEEKWVYVLIQLSVFVIFAAIVFTISALRKSKKDIVINAILCAFLIPMLILRINGFTVDLEIAKDFGWVKG